MESDRLKSEITSRNDLMGRISAETKQVEEVNETYLASSLIRQNHYISDCIRKWFGSVFRTYSSSYHSGALNTPLRACGPTPHGGSHPWESGLSGSERLNDAEMLRGCVRWRPI